MFESEIVQEFAEVLADILAAIPSGSIFDDSYVINQLATSCPNQLRRFIALHSYESNPAEMTAAMISSEIEKFEGLLVEEQDVSEACTEDGDEIDESRRWKRI